MRGKYERSMKWRLYFGLKKTGTYYTHLQKQEHSSPPTHFKVHKRGSEDADGIKSIISYKRFYSKQKQLWPIQFPPTEGDLHQ